MPWKLMQEMSKRDASTSAPSIPQFSQFVTLNKHETEDVGMELCWVGCGEIVTGVLVNDGVMELVWGANVIDGDIVDGVLVEGASVVEEEEGSVVEEFEGGVVDGGVVDGGVVDGGGLGGGVVDGGVVDGDVVDGGVVDGGLHKVGMPEKLYSDLKLSPPQMDWLKDCKLTKSWLQSKPLTASKKEEFPEAMAGRDGLVWLLK